MLEIIQSALTDELYLSALHSLYPPTTTCTNSFCPKDTELLRNINKTGRKVVLFTLDGGAYATYHYKLICPSEYFSRELYYAVN